MTRNRMKHAVFMIGTLLSCFQTNAQAVLKIDSTDHIYLENMEFLRTESGNRFGYNEPSLDGIEYQPELLWERFYWSNKRK